MANDDIARVYDQLNDIRADIAGLRSDISTFTERCGNCRDKIERIDHAVYGNGDRGILRELDAVRQRRPAPSIKALTGIILAVSALTTGFQSIINALTPHSAQQVQVSQEKK